MLKDEPCLSKAKAVVDLPVYVPPQIDLNTERIRAISNAIYSVTETAAFVGEQTIAKTLEALLRELRSLSGSEL